jgi:hypothetical protein
VTVQGTIFSATNWNPSHSKFAGSENPDFTSDCRYLIPISDYSISVSELSGTFSRINLHLISTKLFSVLDIVNKILSCPFLWWWLYRWAFRSIWYLFHEACFACYCLCNNVKHVKSVLGRVGFPANLASFRKTENSYMLKGWFFFFWFLRMCETMLNNTKVERFWSNEMKRQCSY